MQTTTTKNPDPNVRNSGMLDVGDGHQIYWEDWGNPDATPAIHFHGGPGGGTNESHKLLFNPERHRVIFFDQRGSGKSLPFAEVKDNTTQKLIEDTEKLRELLNIEKVYLIGGSWGSTMTLAYAIAHPERVLAMVSWGIYLGSQSENDFLAHGYPRFTYPEAWERFISHIPEEHRTSGRSITEYVSKKLHSEDQEEALKYADEWSLWESSVVTIRYDKPTIEKETIGATQNLALARLETHYFLNNCFMPDNYILDNVDIIKHIPFYVVQGRFDNCTPPITAYTLSKAYGKNMILHMVNAGHNRSDPETRVAIRAAVNTMFV